MDIVNSLERFLAGTEPTKAVRTRMTKAINEIVRLRHWIREEGQRGNSCTFYILGEVCENCECSRKPSN